MSAKPEFPLLVKHDSVHVKVYRIKAGCRNEHYVISFYESGHRQRRYFSDLAKAIAEARGSCRSPGW